jgi:two-component system NarL family response regulator
MQVIASTGDSSEVTALARATAPHIVCMDISMPGLGGIEATRILLLDQPHIKVIALSAYPTQYHIMAMLSVGASGFVCKTRSSDELIEEIRVTLSPNTDKRTTTANIFLQNQKDLPPQVTSIGPREWQVLRLVAMGHKSNQIAVMLDIACATVDVHRRNIMRKLNIKSVAELTRYVMSHENQQPPSNRNK